ncbi:MAG TPA: hypothetical protein VGE02_08025 [Gemmatimonadales bacterium]
MKRILSTTTFTEAVELFDRKNIAGLVPDGRTGALGMKSKNRRNQIVSNTRNALRVASGMDDVDDLVLTPFLEVLPACAKRHGNDRDGASGDAAASDVRCFLRTVEGREYKTKRRVVRETFLPEWKPLGEALLGPEGTPPAAPDGVPPDRWRRYAGWLTSFQEVLLIKEHRSPTSVPDHETAMQWCREAGYSEKEAGNLFVAYRKARELTGALHLPPLTVPPRVDPRGIRSIPDLAERMTAGAARLADAGRSAPATWAPGRHPADMPVLDILDLVAPEFAWATQTYVRWARGEGMKSEAWIAEIEDTASVLVAELARMGEDVTSLDYMDLYTERRQVPRSGMAETSGSKRAPARGAMDDVILLRKLVDTAAPASFARSPLTLPEEQAKAAVPYYTPAIFNNVVAVWCVMQQAYGVGLGYATAEDHADAWRDIEREHDRLVQHMKKHNDGRHVGGQKNKDLVKVTWGQAVCVGLLEKWRTARERRLAWHLAFERNGGATAPEAAAKRPAVEAARRAYCRALREYIQAAVLLDDGMRIRNYANARIDVNVHVVGDQDPTTGLWRRVDTVTMTFRGYDRVAGTKKKRLASTGAEGKRTRQLTRGVVDHELFADYLNECRIDDLVRARLITSRDAYATARDRWALFVSTSVGEKKRKYGGYTEAALSKRFGRFLHRLCRDLLDLRDEEGRTIPTWSELRAATPEGRELRLKWRGLWNAHVLRQLIATFIGGLMQNWIEAVARTHDTIATLQNIYLNHEALVNDLNKNVGIQRADWFVPVCRRLVAGEQIDWATFDPQRPDGAMAPPVSHQPAAATTSSQRRREAA